MKKIFLIITSAYSLVLLSILLVAGVEFDVPTWILALLIPIWIYFGIRLARLIPVVSLFFSRRHYRFVERVFGVYAAIFTLLAVIANVIFIRELLHVAFVAVLLPPFVHFLWPVGTIAHKIRKRRMMKQEASQEVPAEVVQPVEHVSPDATTEIQEEQRRKFLKLVAGAGVGVFAASILNPKKASAAFFGSVPGAGVIAIKDSNGVKIDPSIKSPTDGFAISHIDAATYPAYYGFVNKDGNWYVMRENPQNTFQYATGLTLYGTNWTNRSDLTYASFDATF